MTEGPHHISKTESMKPLIFYILTSVPVISFSQILLDKDFKYLHDDQFHWQTDQSCLPHDQCIELIQGIDQPPVVTKMDSIMFRQFLAKMVQKLSLPVETSGMLKLRFIFFANDQMCLGKTGQFDLQLDNDQLNTLYQQLKVLVPVSGKYKGKPVSTEGILYMSIENGAMKDFLNRNFDLVKRI